MLRKIPIITAIILCSLIITQYVPGAEDPDSQLKQAEELAKTKQYDQAEQIYLAIAQQDIPEAFAAQKSLAILYITQKPPRLDLADAAYEQLLSRFASHNDLPKAVYDIGRRYEETNKNDKAFQLYEYNLEHFPDNTYAMWSLTGIAKYHIRDGNDPAANAAVDKLLTAFSKEPGLPEQIHYVARKYEEFQKHEKALELYQYNVEHFPNDIYAMRSQVRIVRTHIQDGSDIAANEAYDKLLKLYANNPSLPEEVYKIGKKFGEAGDVQKAHQVYQYVIDTWSSTTDVESLAFVVLSYFGLGNEQEAQIQLDKLITEFSRSPGYPKAMFVIGGHYYREAYICRRQNLREQAEHYLKEAIAAWARVNSALTDSSGTPHAWYFSGKCYSELRDYEKALDCYCTVLKLWPSYKYAGCAQYWIADCYEHLKYSKILPRSQADENIEQAYKAVIDKYPDCGLLEYAYLHLGRLYLERNEAAKAAPCFDLFLKTIGPNDRRAKWVEHDLQKLADLNK